MDVLGCTTWAPSPRSRRTIRDVLLGAGRRAFWMEVEYLWICVAARRALASPRTSAAVGLVDHARGLGGRVGVGAFCVIGAERHPRERALRRHRRVRHVHRHVRGRRRGVLIDRPVASSSYTDVCAARR